MKLTTAQINALASKIDSEIVDSIRKHNKELTDNQIKFYKKYIKKNKTLEELYNYNSSPIQRYLQDKYREEFEAICKSLINNDWYGERKKNIKNEIILKTIDCENLEELINSVKAKFVSNG